MDEMPTGPGYDRHGNWHGSVTDEVLYWKRRALAAEARLPTLRQDEPITIEAGRAVLRRG